MVGDQKTRIVILGGGFGGAYAAQKLLRRSPDLDVVLIDRHNYLLYYPLLIEAAVGVIEARHVVVPTRAFLGNKGNFVMAEVTGHNSQSRTVEFKSEGENESRTLAYDHLIVGLGSITRAPDIEGLSEYGYQLKSLGDGIALRDRAIRLLERGNLADDPEKRKALLTVVVVGANYTGVELAGEYAAFLRTAAKSYPSVRREDIQIVLVEYSDRILPTLDAKLADYSVRTMTKRGVRVLTKTSVKSVTRESAILTTGETVPTHTVVWCAGIAPNPLLAKFGLPLNEKGYIPCERDMHVKGMENVWAIGDAATIMDDHGKPYGATAQNASRQGPRVAENILAELSGRPTKPFQFGNLGSFASIGDRMAAANVLGQDLTGFLGWLVYRTAYLSKFPTFRMKLRLSLDWFADFWLPYAPVQLGLHRAETLGVSEKENAGHETASVK
jgi:NADH dehydrogenase